MKYNVWSSTKSGNQTLNNAFKKAKEEGGDVFLIFRYNKLFNC
ncbi:YTH domain-containing protein [archaeon]|nr:YTH domain-containing protein [archaeon]